MLNLAGVIDAKAYQGKVCINSSFTTIAGYRQMKEKFYFLLQNLRLNILIGDTQQLNTFL